MLFRHQNSFVSQHLRPYVFFSHRLRSRVHSTSQEVVEFPRGKRNPAYDDNNNSNTKSQNTGIIEAET